MRKGFKFIDPEKALTKVTDHVSATIPDQALGLRELMMQFAYIGTDRLEEIVNRGFDGDEDDPNIIGVDVSAMDYAEVHDRYLELLQQHNAAVRSVHNPAAEPQPVPQPEPQPEPQPDDDQK